MCGLRVASLCLLLASSTGCGSDDSGGSSGGTSSGGTSSGGTSSGGASNGGTSSGGGGSSGGSGGASGGAGGVSGSGSGGTSSGGSAGSASGGAPTGLRQFFDDDLEYSNIDEATSVGPWASSEGATLTTEQAHGGTHALKIAYTANESQQYLQFIVDGASPGQSSGASKLLVEWWEYRPGNYDWAGEKLNRYFGRLGNGNVSLDYPMGWSADGGPNGYGSPATDGPGDIGAFGNSLYTNGKDYFSVDYGSFTTDTWHHFSYFIDLGTLGQADGQMIFEVDGVVIGEASNLTLRPSQDQNGGAITESYTLDAVWMGGWYSGNGDPNPSPAVRYIDDVKAWRD
jgi:hypothetical protein